MSSSTTRIRLCLKDLYHQDVVEMIERETRKYEIHAIDSPDHPDFDRAYDLLWGAFGAQGEMERREVIADFLRAGPFRQGGSGTFIKYFLLVAKHQDGSLCGVRDGTVLINPSYAPDLCLVYLSHIYMLPQARGTVLSYWLRIAPVEIAVQHMAALHARGKLALPAPNAPGRYFGMRMNLCAEMEYFSPDERHSWERILFYGRGGFDVINPRHFPYRQPDFRDPEEIRRTGNVPVPFMLLVRRLGRERQAALPIGEAQAIMRLLYDDFSTHCAPEFLENSLEYVMRRLEERAQKKNFVELLPLPTGSKDLHRLKRLSRYQVYTQYYKDTPEARRYVRESGMRERLAANPRLVEETLARIAAEMEGRPHFVYGSRDKAFSWDGAAVVPSVTDPDHDECEDTHESLETLRAAVEARLRETPAPAPAAPVLVPAAPVLVPLPAPPAPAAVPVAASAVVATVPVAPADPAALAAAAG